MKPEELDELLRYEEIEANKLDDDTDDAPAKSK